MKVVSARCWLGQGWGQHRSCSTHRRPKCRDVGTSPLNALAAIRATSACCPYAYFDGLACPSKCQFFDARHLAAHLLCQIQRPSCGTVEAPRQLWCLLAPVQCRRGSNALEHAAAAIWRSRGELMRSRRYHHERLAV